MMSYRKEVVIGDLVFFCESRNKYHLLVQIHVWLVRHLMTSYDMTSGSYQVMVM